MLKYFQDNALFYFNLLIYWIPFAVLGIRYFLKSMLEYEADIKARQEGVGKYRPQLKIKTILGRIFLTILPVLNIVTLLVIVAEWTIYSIGPGLEYLLDLPLVRDSHKYESLRRENYWKRYGSDYD